MIEVNNLTKHYGEFTAVDNLSFSLAPGEILGFLGPNGAGKSTTMKMLTGFLRPSAGSISVLGHDMWQSTLTAQNHIGYLPEGAPSYEEMTPLAFLRFVAEARGLGGAVLEESVRKAIATMSLDQVLDQKIETLSKGFKRRVGLAQAIVHDPDVLILDEPTDGLDPNQKHQVREMIKGLSKDKIVIISTHILEEVTAVCNRVMVLAAGKLVSDTTPDQLLEKSTYHGAVTVSLNPQQEQAVVAKALRAMSGVEEIIEQENEFTVIPLGSNSDVFNQVFELASAEGWSIDSIHVEKGRLDEVFRGLTEGAVQ
jgi:ABC-2 type transport system ATP-binding protein